MSDVAYPNRYAIMSDVVTELRRLLDSDALGDVTDASVTDDATGRTRKVSFRTPDGSASIYLYTNPPLRKAAR